MSRSIILPIIILVYVDFAAIAQPAVYDSIVNERFSQIRKGLDTTFFVKRYESIETPCVCIDSTDDKKAHVFRETINSNYRIQLRQNGQVDDAGVQCLSKFYDRYARFRVTTFDPSAHTLTGECSFTYGYPAASIIQYLGFYHRTPGRDNAFYNRLLQSKGWFMLYQENDKFKMKVSLDSGPYHKKDTFTAYLEIVQNVYTPSKKIVYELYFDQMNIFTGDKKNQIFLKFASTSFTDEAVYHTNLLFNKLRYINATNNPQLYAEAVWVKNFFADPRCSQCAFIYEQAQYMVDHNIFILPNTEPSPAH